MSARLLTYNALARHEPAVARVARLHDLVVWLAVAALAVVPVVALYGVLQASSLDKSPARLEARGADASEVAAAQAAADAYGWAAFGWLLVQALVVAAVLGAATVTVHMVAQRAERQLDPRLEHRRQVAAYLLSTHGLQVDPARRPVQLGRRVIVPATTSGGGQRTVTVVHAHADQPTRVVSRAGRV